MMKGKEQMDLHASQMESMGRIIAGFSHEMKNHLGIIRESNGLVGDVLEFQGMPSDEKTLKRLQAAVDTIEKRIVIAAEMLHHLSSFAHRSDTPLSSFHINDLLTELCTFLERFSRLQQVHLVFAPGGDIPPIYTNPSLVHHVLYRLFMFCVQRLAPESILRLETTAEAHGIGVKFILPETEPGGFTPIFEELEEARAQLKATLKEESHDAGNVCCTLSIPQEIL